MQPFRILSWNIRASMTPRVLDAVCADPAVDLLVLSEYRVPKAGDLVAERLRTHGWPHAAHASIPVRQKGVAIFSRHPLRPAPHLVAQTHRFAQWIVSVQVPLADLAVIGAYVPFADGPEKDAVWGALIDAAARNREMALVIAGDFNSCLPHEADSGRGYTVEPLQRMRRVVTDLWETSVRAPTPRDQITWEGPNGKGNRIDFAFGTPSVVRRVLHAEHRHALRHGKASDHSGVIVDLSLSPTMLPTRARRAVP